MNEPQSVAAEKIALSIMAGIDRDGQPLCKPHDLIPLSQAASTLWPVAPFSSLFGYQVPQASAMLWTYVSLYTTLADETETAVNYGFNYDALAQLKIQSGGGNFEDRTGQLLSQAIFNKPLLLVFDSLTTPRIVLTANGSAQAGSSLRIESEFTGYLIPAGLSSAFRDHQTRFV
ncbi:MAG: hypothetical protein ACKVZH_06810 [Blastocatellia bacterium]